MSLNLTPNEFVGYRIKPDWYSFNVVIVKRHGSGSKNAGQEYETTVAYCKNLEFAVRWIVSHASKVRGEMNQRDQQTLDGSVASVEALVPAFQYAQEQALKAVAALEARMNAAGLKTPKDTVKFLGETLSAETLED